MKKFVILTPLLVAVVLFVLSAMAFFWWRENSKSPSDQNEVVRVVVPKGYSASQIGSLLYKEGLIKSELAFKFYVQLTNKTKKLKPGEFNILKNKDLTGVVEKLLKGPDELWVTIPEGLRKEEIAEKIIDQLDPEDTGFYEEFISFASEKEGYLFPDTYLFPSDVSAEKVVEKMLATFNAKYDSLTLSEQAESRSRNDIVTMASIIERETKTDQERPIVSGILWKRIDTQGWLMQADATVQYQIANINCRSRPRSCDWWPILTRQDLEVDSEYNSYLYKGLPPTPISNPGISSLNAALNPKESDYWFYIHDEKAEIHYAKDIESHNQNVRIYLGK